MKKLSSLLVAAAMLAFVACGPSAEELAKKKAADSIKMADSLAKIELANKAKADSIAKVEMDKKVADSIAEAEKKGGKKK